MNDESTSTINIVGGLENEEPFIWPENGETKMLEWKLYLAHGRGFLMTLDRTLIASRTLPVGVYNFEVTHGRYIFLVVKCVHNSLLS